MSGSGWSLFGKSLNLPSLPSLPSLSPLSFLPTWLSSPSSPGSSNAPASTPTGSQSDFFEFHSSSAPNTRILVYTADITGLKVDAVVNAANVKLKHGKGVSGALLKACGPQLQADCDQILRERHLTNLPTSQNIYTKRCGSLLAQFVIHAVGPSSYVEKDQKRFAQLLANTFENIFHTAKGLGVSTLAMPLISSGNNLRKAGFGPEVCCQVLWSTIANSQSQPTELSALKELHLVNCDPDVTQAIVKAASSPDILKVISQVSSGAHPQGNPDSAAAAPAADSSGPFGFLRNLFTLSTTTTPADSDSGSQPTSTSKATPPSTAEFAFPNSSESTAASAASGSAPLSTSIASGSNPNATENCPCCMSDVLRSDFHPFNCGHGVCNTCWPSLSANSFKCPICNAPFATPKGTQPPGTMDVKEDRKMKLPGFENDSTCQGTIAITYYIPSGTQGAEHPNPGQPYTGTSRMGYLPNNPEGKKVLQLLRKAWDAKLIFTIGKSVTTGKDNCVIWNNIHHKTNTHGGPTRFGYPDPKYLERVTDELKAAGIT